MILLILYIISIILNIYLYRYLQKLDPDYYPNPIAIFACFLFLFGTITFITLLLLEILSNTKTPNWIDKIFKQDK